MCIIYILFFFSFPPVHLNESNLKSKPRGGRWYLQGTGPQFFFSPPRHITYSKEGSVCKFLCVCRPVHSLLTKKKSESSPFPDWNAGGFSALWRENIKSSSVAHIRFFFFSRCCCFGVVVCRCQVRSRARRIPPSWNVSPLVSPISWRGDSRPQWKEPRKTTERAATYSSKKREPFRSQTKEPSEDHGADACQVIWVGLVCTSRRAANPLSFCGALKVVRTRWPPLFQPRLRAVPKKGNQRRLNWMYKRNLTIVQGSSRVYICLVNYMGRVFIWMPAPHSTLSQHPLPLLIWRRVHHGVAIVCRPRDCKPLECWMRAFCVHLRDLFV